MWSTDLALATLYTLTDLIIGHFLFTSPIIPNMGSLPHPNDVEEAPVYLWSTVLALTTMQMLTDIMIFHAISSTPHIPNLGSLPHLHGLEEVPVVH